MQEAVLIIQKKVNSTSGSAQSMIYTQGKVKIVETSLIHCFYIALTLKKIYPRHGWHGRSLLHIAHHL